MPILVAIGEFFLLLFRPVIALFRVIRPLLVPAGGKLSPAARKILKTTLTPKTMKQMAVESAKSMAVSAAVGVGVAGIGVAFWEVVEVTFMGKPMWGRVARERWTITHEKSSFSERLLFWSGITCMITGVGGGLISLVISAITNLLKKSITLVVSGTIATLFVLKVTGAMSAIVQYVSKILGSHDDSLKVGNHSASYIFHKLANNSAFDKEELASLRILVEEMKVAIDSIDRDEDLKLTKQELEVYKSGNPSGYYNFIELISLGAGATLSSKDVMKRHASLNSVNYPDFDISEVTPTQAKLILFDKYHAPLRKYEQLSDEDFNRINEKIQAYKNSESKVESTNAVPEKSVTGTENKPIDRKEEPPMSSNRDEEKKIREARQWLLGRQSEYDDFQNTHTSELAALAADDDLRDIYDFCSCQDREVDDDEVYDKLSFGRLLKKLKNSKLGKLTKGVIASTISSYFPVARPITQKDELERDDFSSELKYDDSFDDEVAYSNRELHELDEFSAFMDEERRCDEIEEDSEDDDYDYFIKKLRKFKKAGWALAPHHMLEAELIKKAKKKKKKRKAKKKAQRTAEKPAKPVKRRDVKEASRTEKERTESRGESEVEDEVTRQLGKSEERGVRREEELAQESSAEETEAIDESEDVEVITEEAEDESVSEGIDEDSEMRLLRRLRD